MKKIKKTSIIISVIIFLFMIIGIVFSTVYEDKVKNYIITQINNSIDTKIDVQEIEFSVFKKFPYASLSFKQVTIKEITKQEKKGNLFTAQSVYLQFNIIDILNENYSIKKIAIDNGMVNIKIDEYGGNNYHFWKKSNQTNKQLALKLEALTLKNINFYIYNQYKKLDIHIEAKKLTFSGNFYNDKFSLNTQANLIVHQLNNHNKSILNNKNITLSTTLYVNQKTNIYTIKKGEIALEKLKFNIKGNINHTEIGIDLNIKSEGKSLAIEELFSLLPQQQKEVLSDYKAVGKITYSSTIIGLLSAKETPHFEANFSVSSGIITERYSDKSVTNLSFTGNFTNGSENSSKSSKLYLNELNADFGAGHIAGNYVITNFTNPHIQFESEAHINIATAKAFFKIDSLEIASGNLDINLIYDGYINELNNIKAAELQKLNAKGSVQLTNVNLKIVNNTKKIKNINGFFQFNNNTIKIEALKFGLNNSHFELNGKLKNLLAFLFIKEQQLSIKTNFYATKLVLDDLLAKNNTNKSDKKYTIALPKNIVLDFSAKIDTFQFRKFSATHFKGIIQLNNNVLTAKNISFNALKGKVTGNIALDDSKENKILITGKLNTQNIDIYELLYQFENFNQKAIKAENINGKATTEIEFASVWNKQLKVDKSNIYMLANINITNGELINYPPILAMSKYIEVKELEHIKFKRLVTKIEIKNKTVHIPKTEINSSILDLTFSGTHTFNNEIDYRFKLLMSDVLWRKAKKKKKENSEFGYIEDDGLGKTALFLHLTGTLNNYKIKYDSKGLKASFKADLKEEKTTLKTILNKEFGWFKKDTSLKKENMKEDDGFIIEWEDEKPKTKKNKSKKGKKKKGFGKFIDKIAKPTEEKFEEFDDI